MSLRFRHMPWCLVLLLAGGLVASAGEAVPAEKDSTAPAAKPETNTGAKAPDAAAEAKEAPDKAPPATDPAFCHDFGKIPEGEKPSHTFTFTNTTGQPLKVLKVRVPCGCAKTSVEKKELAPGEGTPLSVAFSSAGRRGKVSKNLYVLTDSPELAMVKYTVQAVVVPKPGPHCVVPGVYRLGPVAVNGTVEGALVVENGGELDLTVSPGRVPKGLTLAGAFPLVVKPGAKAELKLSYQAPYHKGGQRLELLLRTNDPRRPEAWVVVQAEVAPAPSAKKQDQPGQGEEQDPRPELDPDAVPDQP